MGDLRETKRKTIRRGGVAADVNAVIAASVAEPGRTHPHASSARRTIGRGGLTEVYGETRDTEDDE